MARGAHADVLEQGLNVHKTSATRLSLCEGEPISYAEATTAKPTGKMLAMITVDGADFTFGAGSPNGRKLTVAQKSGTVSASGDADHWALSASVDSRLLEWGVVTLQTLTESNPVQINTFDLTATQPAAPA
jgi:hypothetical protein